MKALLGRPIWMFLAWRQKSRFNIAIKMWWTTQILIYTHWSGSSRIQRDLKRIPDNWIHQWKIISLNQECRWWGGGNTLHLIPTTGEKKSTNLWSNIQLRTFQHENIKEREDFASTCGGLKTWRCFTGLCETRNCSLKTPLNCSSTALFSHTVAALWFHQSSFTGIPPFLCISLYNDTWNDLDSFLLYKMKKISFPACVTGGEPAGIRSENVLTVRVHLKMLQKTSEMCLFSHVASWTKSKKINLFFSANATVVFSTPPHTHTHFKGWYSDPEALLWRNWS